jgi:hypothetical protein
MGLGKERVDVCRSRTRLHSPQTQGLPAARISALLRIQVNLLILNLRWRALINFVLVIFLHLSPYVYFSSVWVVD